MSLKCNESLPKIRHQPSVPNQAGSDTEEIAPVPPFQGSKSDKILTRKRQALFLRQTLLIAERFSYNPVTPSMLASALPWLEREQYDDIAVERNANGNCGYPLCPNPLSTPVHQVYRISSHRRRVYDATVRKPFCSDWCYRAFQHVRKQVSTEPGWCRAVANPIESVKLSLLPRHSSGRPGRLVLDALNRLNLDDGDSSRSSDDESDENKSDSSSHTHSSSATSDISSDSSNSECRHRAGHWDSDDDIENDVDLLPTNRLKPDRFISKTKRVPVETVWGKQVKVPTRNLVIERTDILDDTNVSSKLVLENPVPPVADNTTTQACDPLHDVSIRLNQWLSPKALDVLTSSDAKDSTDLLVDFTPVVDPNAPHDEDTLPPGVLPLVDSVSANTMRRRLFMEAFGPCIKSFLFRLGVPSLYILSKVDRAVQHFRLTNKNVHLNHTQRAIAALALLRIMAPNELLLHKLMDDSELKTILMSVYDMPVDQFIRIVVQPFASSK